MGNDHMVRERDIEADPSQKAKLNAFRERAKAHVAEFGSASRLRDIQFD